MSAAEFFCSIENFYVPQILAEEKNFLIVYKPPGMHSAPLARSPGETLTIPEWCAAKFPEIRDLPGRQAGEGGLLHRLDFDTHGLLLVARTAAGMESLLALQREGKIVKEYSALASESKTALPGMPAQKPEFPAGVVLAAGIASHPFSINSAFRAYGPGRKSVRPLMAGSAETETLYTTEVIGASTLPGNICRIRVRITRGFRHQIRCHLAWAGMPILNDKLYGGASYGKGLLGLRACSLIFTDPSSGIERLYSIPVPEPGDI